MPHSEIGPVPSGFPQHLAPNTQDGVRDWMRQCFLVGDDYPTTPAAFTYGASHGVADALEALFPGVFDVDNPEDFLAALKGGPRRPKRENMQQNEAKPEEATEVATTKDPYRSEDDLGGDKEFPQDLAPHTAESIRKWVKLSILTEDPKTVGVPTAFRLGVIGGMKDGLTEALPLLRSANEDELAASFEVLLRFIKMAGVE